MTNEQDEFEKFVRRANGTWAEKCLVKYPDGRYQVLQTWNDWVAWQACWLARENEVGALKSMIIGLSCGIEEQNKLIDSMRLPKEKPHATH